MAGWDFSIWQRAEAVWQEARTAAAEQRLARQAEQGTGRRPAGIGRYPAWIGSLAARLVAMLRRHPVKRLAGPVVLLLVMNAATVAASAAEPSAHHIRVLAENILGHGMVRTIRVADGGTTVVIRWESATYRPANPLATTRELLYGEAELVTGAVSGALPTAVRVRFTIVKGERVLAGGETGSASRLTVAYAAHLGGGTYTDSGRAVRPARPGGDRPASEL